MDKPEEAAELLFGEALELSADERRVFLDRACAGQPGLRRRVEALLEENARLDGFLSMPAYSPAEDSGDPARMKPLPKGARLGRYSIVEPLGSGGMGEVFRARDESLDRDVAVKVLLPALAEDAERVARFRREARALAALNHPNICTIYEIGEQDGRVFIAMEYLDGESLEQRLKRRRMELDAVLTLGLEIADALVAAHAASVVHRDIKPANLFVTNRQHLKVLDFGLAKFESPGSRRRAEATTRAAEVDLTTPGTTMGTVAYMSPEMVQGKDTDARSDLFSFGVVLYEAVTGVRPFRGESRGLVFDAILNREPAAPVRLNPDVPPLLEQIIGKALEKNCDLRYQHASEMRADLQRLKRDTDSSGSRADVRPAVPVVNPVARVGWNIPAAAGLVLLAALGVYFWMRPAGVPLVSNYVQLTHDGRYKDLIGTDGARIYLGGYPYVQRNIAQLPIAGGEPTPIPVSSPTMFAVSVDPDGSKLLLVDDKVSYIDMPLWSLPVLGGSPRRLGDTMGREGTWSPDGVMLAYSSDASLFLAKADGTGSRKLVTAGDPVDNLAWSPDGGHLRFTVESSKTINLSSIWEVSVDGSGLHPLLPGYADSACCGRWTADGNYFVFESNQQIWTLPRNAGFSHSEAKPIQLTSSPLSLTSPLPSKDGKKLFVVGKLRRGEMTRFDERTHQFSPFLGGISAEYLASSRDGKWIAYVSYPEGALWRSKPDGSQRSQLTYPPISSDMPRWSPDGKTILFTERSSGKLYAIASEGGSPRELMQEVAGSQFDPSWSPDGDKIAFGVSSDVSASAIRIFDVASHEVRPLPGSEGLYSPRWSLDGRYILAMSSDSARLRIFDFQTRQWTELATGVFAYPNWSKDGRFVYVMSFVGKGAIVRIRIRDHKVEQIANLNGFNAIGSNGAALTLTFDDAPVLLRDVGTEDVYSLDWKAP